MDFQEIVVYVIVLVAIVFLVQKIIWRPKSKKNCGDNDCGCH
jgi:hypothetical protein